MQQQANRRLEGHDLKTGLEPLLTTMMGMGWILAEPPSLLMRGLSACTGLHSVPLLGIKEVGGACLAQADHVDPLGSHGLSVFVFSGPDSLDVWVKDVPDEEPKRVKVTGTNGTVIIFNGNVIHRGAATSSPEATFVLYLQFKNMREESLGVRCPR